MRKYPIGIQTFLVKLIQRKGEFKFEDIQLSEIALGSFDIENPLPAALLFQTGYLTIREYDSGGGIYTPDYPNKEVEQSLVDAFLSVYRTIPD
ncbi:MAG: hypothetical protein AB2L24_08520 [Mangrovibacterium sp.]